MTNRIAPHSTGATLAEFLQDRRRRMDAAALGYGGRRRTPGLRREEVAQRAAISTTWYTWLEQGRGGPPSSRVLDSLAGALLLTAVEREHLFLLALGHPPKARLLPQEGISARLQRLLDAWAFLPATVATAAWDIVGWNSAARRVLTDYPALPPEERNIMLRMFLHPETRAAQGDWEGVARFLVATFRAETARAGETEAAAAVLARLTEESAEFRRIWSETDLQSPGEGTKIIRHHIVGRIAFEFSSFAVDGRPDLKLIVYNPSGPEDIDKVRALCAPDAASGA